MLSGLELYSRWVPLWQAMDDVEHEWLRLVSVIIFLVPVLFKLNSESKQLRLYSFIIAQILIISPTFFT